MIAEAIETVLENTAAITALLATYDFGGGSEGPAIFTLDPLPKDHEVPAILITEEAGTRWGTFVHHGMEWFNAQIRVFDNKRNSHARLRNISQLVWETMDLANLVVPGYEDIGTYCDPPGFLTDPDGFPMAVLNVRVRLLDS